MRPGLTRLLPLPLGIVGGLAGGALWLLLLVLNPDLHNDLDEVEGYIVAGTAFMGWGLLLGCFFAIVPPFAHADDPARAGASYRARRAVWLYALPALLAWGAVVGIAIEANSRGGVPDPEIFLLLVFASTIGGASWIAQECCDWLLPRFPAGVGLPITAAAIAVLSLSLGTVLILGSPFLIEQVVPRGNSTAMAAAIDLLEADLEGYTIMMIGPAVQGGLLAVMVPLSEAAWGVPRPRRRDLGAAPYLLLALPPLALFYLGAVIIDAR